jgi:hypothetical protein
MMPAPNVPPTAANPLRDTVTDMAASAVIHLPW